MMTTTWNCAASAPGRSQTIAAMRNPAATPRNAISSQPWCVISALIASIMSRSSGLSTGAKVQKIAANSVPAMLARNTTPHMRPRLRRWAAVGSAITGDGDGVLGEQLLARQHHHHEADRVAEAADQRTPRCVGQVHPQDGLCEQGEADRKAGRDAGPPQRGGGAPHFLLTQPTHDLINDRCARGRSLRDILNLAFGDPGSPVLPFRASSGARTRRRIPLPRILRAGRAMN